MVWFLWLPSNVGVLPVLGVIDDPFAFDVRVEAVVLDHARLAQVARELPVEPVQHRPLGHDARGVRAHTLCARLVDDVRVVLDDI